MQPIEKQEKEQLILSEEVYNKINDVVSNLYENTNVDCVVFCESNGYPVSHKGEFKQIDMSAISALAAANFSATAEMASMIGEEDSFKYLFHEGEHRNIYLSNVDYNFLLLIIFDVKVTLGMVRIFTKKAMKDLDGLLKSAKEEGDESKEFVDLQFKSLLNEEINRTLKF